MIKDSLQEKIKVALKSGDKIKTSTYRMLLSALNNEQIAKQRDLTAEEELQVIKRQVKQREEARESWSNAGRKEEAEKEAKEGRILKEFLPEQMGQEQIEVIVDRIVSESDNQDFGKVMRQVMAQTQGKADGKIVSELVRQKLST